MSNTAIFERTCLFRPFQGEAFLKHAWYSTDVLPQQNLTGFPTFLSSPSSFRWLYLPCPSDVELDNFCCPLFPAETQNRWKDGSSPGAQSTQIQLCNFFYCNFVCFPLPRIHVIWFYQTYLPKKLACWSISFASRRHLRIITNLFFWLGFGAYLGQPPPFGGEGRTSKVKTFCSLIEAVYVNQEMA